MTATTTPRPAMASAPRPKPLRHAADAALLEAVRCGDADAAAELYLRYHRDLRRYAASRLPGGSPDDVVSEAFARTLRALHNGAGPRDHALRYLFVAARTIIMATDQRDRRRADAQRRYCACSSTGDGPTNCDATLAVHDAFGRLSQRQRMVLWMSEVEGVPPREIGVALGVRPAAVHSLTFRARRALRDAYAAACARLER